MKINNVRLDATPLVLAMMISSAYAQTAAPATAAAPAEPAASGNAKGEAPPTLQSVTVTATRRATDLQKVAATVDVVSSEAVDQLHITNVSDMQGLVPGMTIVQTAGTVPFIRGVGTNNSGFTTETAVAMYIDGLYLANSASGLFGFNNIERIEVLKGPQGTLYGRNTTGGLVNVITRDPEAKTHVDASIGYESYDKTILNFYGSTPLTDTLAMNIAVVDADQRKGWGRNAFTGDQDLKSHESGAQVKLVWKPAAGTKVSLRSFADYMKSDIGLATSIVPGTFGVDGSGNLGKYVSNTRSDPYVRPAQFNDALKVEQEFASFNLMSMTGYQHDYEPLRSTINGIPGNPVIGQSAVEAFVTGSNKTFSEEIQLSSKPSSAPYDWIGGLFYYNDRTQLESSIWGTCVGTTCAAAPLPNYTYAVPTTQSISAYADGSYTLRPGTRLTLGLRYTEDRKGLTGYVAPLPGLPNSVTALPPSTVLQPGNPYPGNPAGIPTEVKFSKPTFRVALSQDLAEHAQAYASFNRGYKAGGYNPSSFTNPVSKPETLDSIEAGVKSEFFDRRLRLNAAVFNYQYDDIQLRSTAPPAPVGSSILTNAAKARVNGADADFSIAATSSLSITGGLSLLDAKYASYPGGSCSTAKVPAGPVLGGATTVVCDLSGHQMPDAPKVSYSLGFTYDISVPYGSMELAANDAYKSKFNFSSDGNPTQKAYHVSNMSLKWRTPDERYDVQLHVKNLFNSFYYTSAIGPSSGSYLYSPSAPRIFGVVLGYHY